jgi:glycosyltransferase involved in cell wall biosynthesis
MLISIAICTWNRGWLLGQTLAHLAKLNVPEGLRCELLVVDNCSTDDTRQVVDNCASPLPITYVYEKQKGKAFAANAAIDRSHGEYIIWIDDDVLPSVDWLAAYAKAFQAWPAAGFFGGPIEPHFPNGMPEWLSDCWHLVQGAYGKLDFGRDEVILSKERLPWGANFAVKSSVQRQFRYDTRFGMFGGKRIGGYETEMLARIVDAGIEGRWVPAAGVGHYIRNDQLSLRFLRSYFLGSGRSAAVKDMNAREANAFLGTPMRTWRNAVSSEMKFRLCRFVASPRVYVAHLIRASRGWGRITQNLAMNGRNQHECKADAPGLHDETVKLG